MTAKQFNDAEQCERDLRSMAQREKAQYKARTFYDAANLLRDLINDEDDEIPPVDD